MSEPVTKKRGVAREDRLVDDVLGDHGLAEALRGDEHDARGTDWLVRAWFASCLTIRATMRHLVCAFAAAIVCSLAMTATATAQRLARPSEDASAVGGAPAARTASTRGTSAAREDGRLWLDFAFHSQRERLYGADARVSSLSWLFAGRFTLAHFGAQLRFPLSWAKVSGDNVDQTDFETGNLELQMFWVWDTGPWHIEAGLGVALPTAHWDSLARFVVAALAGATRGLWDYWLWQPRQWSSFAPAQIEYAPENFGVGLDVAIGVMVPVDNFFALPLAQGVFQIRGWGAYVSDTLRAGIMMQSVTLTNDSGFPGTTTIEGGGAMQQTSVGPFAEVHVDRLFGGGEMLLNLDRPVGFAGTEGAEVWGVRLYGGARF